MNGYDSFTSSPNDLRCLVEGEGRRLEGVEVVIGGSAFAVITYLVDYRERPSFKTPPDVVKFSKKEHAITTATHIRLGSSRYYREYEGDIAGIADPEEARLVQRGWLHDFCVKNGVSPQPWFDQVSSTVTWARADFLMFCTSASKEGRDLGGLRGRFPDYDCATVIPDPSAFAMQLGKDVANQFNLEEVRLSVFDKIKRMKLSEAEITMEGHVLRKGLDAVVSVSHGPVMYCDPPEKFVNRFPIETRGEVVPFVKRGDFSGDGEYRFVVDVIGEPQETEFLMEITDELRSLTHAFPEFEQRKPESTEGMRRCRSDEGPGPVNGFARP